MDRSYDDIASRAYDLFLSRGGQHGRDIDDWLEAERQLTSNGTPPRPTRRLASTPRATNRTKRQKTRRSLVAGEGGIRAAHARYAASAVPVKWGMTFSEKRAIEPSASS